MMKAKPSLLPSSALLRVSDLMTKAGEGKHSDEKWKTMTVQEHVDATLRHLLTHISGTTVDPEFLHTHLTHAAARLLMAVAVQGAPQAGAKAEVLCTHIWAHQYPGSPLRCINCREFK